MTWKDVDADILELFGEAFHSRGHVQNPKFQAASAKRSYDFGELSAARFGLRTSKRAKSEEAREFTKYYYRKWKAAVKADPVKADRFRELACSYARKGWAKLKADPKRAAKRKAAKRGDYAKKRDEIRARAAKATTPAMRRAWALTAAAKSAADTERAAHEKALAKARNDRWYAAMKADPVRYAKFLARCAKGNGRRYHAKTLNAKGTP